MIGDLLGADPQEVMDLGYAPVKPIARGLWVGLRQTIGQYGLFVIEDRIGTKGVWFYSYQYEALQAFEMIKPDWDGESSDPPGFWVKAKPSQRLGPGYERSAVRVLFTLVIGQGNDLDSTVGMFANAHEATDEAQRVWGVVFPPDALLRINTERDRQETAWHKGPKVERWARVERKDLY
jgi:hypothetical protein